MDDADPPESPFGAGLPFFGDLSRILGGGADGGWGAARQLAVAMASDGQSEPNVDPSVRIEIEQLARVAELQAVEATGLSPATGGLQTRVVTRTDWADRTLASYKPLFERLSASLSAQPPRDHDTDSGGDPMAAMFGQMMGMLGPMMLSMTAGSMVGHLARRSLGTYDIPVPRGGNEVLIVPANLDAFGDDWSLPAQDLRLWVCLHEVIHHLVLNVPHIGSTLTELLLEYAGGFRAEPDALEQRLEGLDLADPSALQDLQATLGDPEVILGVIQSPEQLALLPRLHALTAVVVGYVDHTMDRIGEGLLSSYGQLTEALRRRRVEADPSDRFIERMLGLELTQAQYERGTAFVAGVVDRAGTAGLDKLWASSRNLPTPNEVDAPGLWLARIEL
ncbi:MAG: zinc-dependent metalloprotease [Acidimicrobiales bacterium]